MRSPLISRPPPNRCTARSWLAEHASAAGPGFGYGTGSMAQSGSILGHPVLRKEDPGLLVGINKYTDDMTYPNLAHIVFVRSSVAHANVTKVDTSAAKGMPGVLAVYTADDLNLPDQVGFAGTPQHTRPPLA